MKVRGHESGITTDPRISGANKSQSSRNATQKKGDAAKVTLSASAESVKGVREKLEKIPEIRSDKVNPIIDEVKNGNYHRPSDKVAEKMIASHLLESSYDE